jgi:hypothetical protein
MELVTTHRFDFFKKREEKERILKEALDALTEHKKRTAETVFPREIYETSRILYSAEHIRLLENAIRAKTSLEVMDMALENMMRERIYLLEKMLGVDA